MKMLNHKFKAKRVDDNGDKFPSKLEWRYFKHLQLLQKAGEIVFFLRQVPFHILNAKYVCDFQIFWYNGEVEFVDVKGFMTDMSALKIKLVEEIYPVKIKIIRKGDF